MLQQTLKTRLCIWESDSDVELARSYYLSNRLQRPEALNIGEFMRAFTGAALVCLALLLPIAMVW